MQKMSYRQAKGCSHPYSLISFLRLYLTRYIVCPNGSDLACQV
jgi:hypothetical protein